MTIEEIVISEYTFAYQLLRKKRKAMKLMKSEQQTFYDYLAPDYLPSSYRY